VEFTGFAARLASETNGLVFADRRPGEPEAGLARSAKLHIV
jgi:hypothetical protein